jgi:hypothetical protein
MNIQDEVSKIHAQFGVSELANYKIQLLFDKHGNEQYNQALEDAAKNADTKNVECGALAVYIEVDKDSILKLKKSVSKSV